VRAVIAESYERIHRSNLVGMGIVPLEFAPGDSVASLGLTGRETFEVSGLEQGLERGFEDGPAVRVLVTADGKRPRSFGARVRIDTPKEVEYVRHGGILQFVLRRLLAG
jgi:aconitate hydratase